MGALDASDGGVRLIWASGGLRLLLMSLYRAVQYRMSDGVDLRLSDLYIASMSSRGGGALDASDGGVRLTWRVAVYACFLCHYTSALQDE